MPAAVGKGTGRTVAIGHQNVPSEGKSSSKRGASRRGNRRSGRK